MIHYEDKEIFVEEVLEPMIFDMDEEIWRVKYIKEGSKERIFVSNEGIDSNIDVTGCSIPQLIIKVIDSLYGGKM